MLFGMRHYVCTFGDVCTPHAEMMKWWKSNRAAVMTAVGTPDFISCLKPEGIFYLKCKWALIAEAENIFPHGTPAFGDSGRRLYPALNNSFYRCMGT